MGRYLGSCFQWATVLGIEKTYCCSSCHWDDDEGYASMPERYADDGADSDWVSVCCSGGEAFDEHPDPWPLLRAAKGEGVA
jgi:pyruvate-formate lyase-activating enzyme